MHGSPTLRSKSRCGYFSRACHKLHTPRAAIQHSRFNTRYGHLIHPRRCFFTGARAPHSAAECAAACVASSTGFGTCDSFQYCDPGGPIIGSPSTCGPNEPLLVNQCGCYIGTATDASCQSSPFASGCQDATGPYAGCTNTAKCAQYFVGCSTGAVVPGGDPFDPANSAGGYTPTDDGKMGGGWILILILGIVAPLAMIVFIFGGAAVQKWVQKKEGRDLWSHASLLSIFPLLVLDGLIFSFSLGKKKPTRTRAGICSSSGDGVANDSSYQAHDDDDDDDDALGRSRGNWGKNTTISQTEEGAGGAGYQSGTGDDLEDYDDI